MKKVMLITGSGRGIGAATALLAAKQDYAVCVHYLNNSAAADAVVNTVERAGGQAITVAADVAIEADVVRLFEKVDTQLGSITALVNNAGIVDTRLRWPIWTRPV